MPVGVICHLHNVGFEDVRALAEAAEAAGADWLGLPDAFWWRDTWLLLAEAARATTRIEIGPMVTNPYLRHPFHTVAAVASLQDLAGERVFVGIGAGGSEVSGAAGVSRRDAPARFAPWPVCCAAWPMASRWIQPAGACSRCVCGRHPS